MQIQEALEFVQSASWVGTHPCLDRIRELMHLLGDPQEQLKFVHITGTNGKGSTAAMLSSILTAAGYKTGLFTSPHLQRYNERIRVNGRDVRSWDLKALRDCFGVVFQNDILFKKSIGENIRIGRNLSMERLEQAAKDAQAAFFVEETGGMDASLEARGANLSGGQKQRLLIARALAGRPEVLILDDSSSALDYQTDARLRRIIHSEYGDTTTVIIAQRVSSVKNCDRILVLEEGKMLGFGTHRELMESCRLYREISRLQMGEGEAV